MKVYLYSRNFDVENVHKMKNLVFSSKIGENYL